MMQMCKTLKVGDKDKDDDNGWMPRVKVTGC